MEPLALTNRQANVFVIGDLVLDHINFVTKKTRGTHTLEDEEVFDVWKRVDTAGGAANSARILASLNRDGHTYLWGITGHIRWGTFRDILANSEAPSLSAANVIFTGYHDEATRMNTITRAIVVDGDVLVRRHRYDEVSFLGPSRLPIESAMSNLENANALSKLSAIILNDLDMNTLSHELVQRIVAFAQREDIRIFVDPKRDASKYATLRGTAIVPSLPEWCVLIGQHNEQERWRNSLSTRHGLEAMARQSLKHFPNFEYHIITCDKDGVVVIGPTSGMGRYKVFHIPPHPPEITRHQYEQLGCGDVITAVTALEYVSDTSADPGIDKIIRAVRVASWVVAAYRQKPWGRMPSREDVRRFPAVPPPALRETELVESDRYIPEAFDYAAVETEVPGLLTTYEEYREALRKVCNLVKTGWDGTQLRSVILTGRGGTGKSQLSKAMPKLLDHLDVEVLRIDDLADSSRNPQTLLRERFPKHANNRCANVCSSSWTRPFITAGMSSSERTVSNCCKPWERTAHVC